jgi:hypothetical protein
MYSRLYRMVLNRHREVETAEAMVEASGLIGIVGASEPRFVEKLVHVLANQFNDLTFEERIVSHLIHPI